MGFRRTSFEPSSWPSSIRKVMRKNPEDENRPQVTFRLARELKDELDQLPAGDRRKIFCGFCTKIVPMLKARREADDKYHAFIGALADGQFEITGWEVIEDGDS